MSIEYGETWLAGNKDYLTDKISQQSSRWIPKWIDRMIADKVLNGMLSTLGEMRNPAHPWRVELRKSVEKLIADLATDPQMQARAERIKAELLASPLLIEQAKTLWAEIENGLNSGLPAHCGCDCAACASRRCADIGAWLLEDEARKARLNGGILGRHPAISAALSRSRSAPISSAWSTTGTPRRWSTGWSCKSARICNISASTARWSADLSDC